MTTPKFCGRYLLKTNLCDLAHFKKHVEYVTFDYLKSMIVVKVPRNDLVSRKHESMISGVPELNGEGEPGLGNYLVPIGGSAGGGIWK